MVQAEYYDTCASSALDNTSGNSGGELRTDDVDIVAIADGYAITDMQPGEYVEYSLAVQTSGLFDISFAVQPHAANTASLALSIDGAVLGTVDIAANDSAAFGEYTLNGVYLSDGAKVIRVTMAGEGAAIGLDSIAFNYTDNTVYTPENAVLGMGIGINLGNTLDAFPNEGDWAPAAQEYYFKAYKDAGFRHVRIPATWDDHTADTAPYTVNAARMDRTEQIVDWALAQGYFVILNAHHEHWLKENYGNQTYRDRFDAIWQQIAERFKNKSARLMFEILNEPNGMTVADVDDLNPRILDIIRETNPTRLVVFSGNGYTPVDALLAAAIPNDDYLIGNFHSYDPWQFGGQCLRSWGTEQDYTDLENIYKRANTWSEQHDIPVMVNEFGAAHYDFTAPQNVCNQQARLAYLGAHATFAIQYGFGASVWDDGGSFEVYKRGENSWREAKDVLVAPNP
ncbi:cellulase family glycosylhydrolase [Saccharophagus degradans]|uniref:cellulase family glycosylhydrolase n=1 Tax=Saccharophagus degradans TaxID=86304 RepID=UPI002477F252|nr:cellulase family glycosylhydrolase [Saccharophagus degradans]WGP00040.1 cellulase family glycosylhydrolase [Saccharophagus degradans]